MILEKDGQFLDYLVRATQEGKIRWQPTAADDVFTTSFKGKYNVLVSEDSTDHRLKMKNDMDQEMLSVNNAEDPRDRVREIFVAARRAALEVDTAIDDIIGEEE